MFILIIHIINGYCTGSVATKATHTHWKLQCCNNALFDKYNSKFMNGTQLS